MINSLDISWNVLHVLQNSQTSDSLHIIKKNENKQFGQIYIHVGIFLRGYLLYVLILEDQKLKQERSCEVLKKIVCFVRSYPRCPVLPRFTVTFQKSEPEP